MKILSYGKLISSSKTNAHFLVATTKSDFRKKLGFLLILQLGSKILSSSSSSCHISVSLNGEDLVL